MKGKEHYFETVNILAELVKETESAYGVKVELDTFEKEAPIVWLPKSKVSRLDDGTFDVPEWLATERGII